MTIKSYTIMNASRSADKTITIGQIVYTCKSYDYGCANDDTKFTGIKHISVTLDPEGKYPFFTIPENDLKEN